MLFFLCLFYFLYFFLFFVVSLRWWMAVGNTPVAMSLEVAYSALPNMIYDQKKGGRRNLWLHYLPSCTSKLPKRSFRGIGLTQHLHTSGLAIFPDCPYARDHLKKIHGKGKIKLCCGKRGNSIHDKDSYFITVLTLLALTGYCSVRCGPSKKDILVFVFKAHYIEEVFIFYTKKYELLTDVQQTQFKNWL